jgi:hypothetical protein
MGIGSDYMRFVRVQCWDQKHNIINNVMNIGVAYEVGNY